MSRVDEPGAARTTGPTAAPYSPRYLHVMLRVRDLDAMLAFYCGQLALREQRRIEFPEQRYTLVFLGYGDDAGSPQIELWHDWDGDCEVRRGAFGHVGIGVRNIDDCVRDLAAQGVTVLREPAAARPGGRRIALLADPEGNEVELLATD